MKDIRIFVASSCKLEKERNALAYFVLAHEDEFAKRGLRVRLSKWEYVDPKMTAGRTEDRYLDEMYNCDAAMVIFKNIAGMYTREELNKALAREAAGFDRIKAHKILFCADGKPDSDAAKLRASLPETSYGVYANLEELKAAFLTLVDEVAKSERLVDVEDENIHEVSAFVAADDELASDRNAFADTILNLNDILARRGIRVRMRFYDPEHHRELLESSEMALVLYDTNYKAFNPDQMHDAYERTKREENPKRLYVFFRDEDESKLDQAFVEFRNAFAEKLGHFFCRFANIDTLRLSFLLSLENLLGEGRSFVKLEGCMIRADGFDLVDMTKIPMVAKNDALADVLKQMEEISATFAEQGRLCEEAPEDDGRYAKLLDLSRVKNALQSRVDNEISSAFNLAKQMAAMTIAEVNESIARACSLVSEGRIKDAIEILDSNVQIDRRQALIARASDRRDEEHGEYLEWKSFVDVDTFRVRAVLAHFGIPIQERFSRGERIYRNLLFDLERYAAGSHDAKIDRLRTSVLMRMSDLYSEIRDVSAQIDSLGTAVKIYRSMYSAGDLDVAADLVVALQRLGGCYRIVNRPGESESACEEALEVARDHVDDDMPRFGPPLALTLNTLAQLHTEQNMFAEAEEELVEALEVWQSVAKFAPQASELNFVCPICDLGRIYISQNRYEEALCEFQDALDICSRHKDKLDWSGQNIFLEVAESMAELLGSQNRFREAERLYWEVLAARREFAKYNPLKYLPPVAQTLGNFATLHLEMNRFDEAERELSESVTIKRRLAESDPKDSGESLAYSLVNLSSLHKQQGKLGVAESECLEAMRILRRLAELNSKKFDEHCARAVSLLASIHSELNHLDKAESEYVEALLVWRRLALQNPEKFDEEVSGTLSSLAAVHHYQCRDSDAESEYAESLKICRRLAIKNPEKFKEQVAHALNNIAIVHEGMGRAEEAESEYEEVLALYRRLVETCAAKFDEHVAMVLGNLAVLHRNSGKLELALREHEEVVAINRRLATENPLKFDEMVADSLTNLAICHDNQGAFEKAECEYLEALEIRKRLAQNEPRKFLVNVYEAYDNLATHCQCRGRIKEASERLYMAIEIARKLVAMDRQYEFFLEDSLERYGKLMEDIDWTVAEKALKEALSILGPSATPWCEKREVEIRARILLHRHRKTIGILLCLALAILVLSLGYLIVRLVF